MRTVDDFAAIRQAHRDGTGIRQLAQHCGAGRDTVRKALQHPEPVPYPLSQPRPAPTFGPSLEIVDAIPAADANAPRKQRHTAGPLFRRPRQEYGYTGGSDQVRRYVQARRRHGRATCIPLDHPPGHRAEADFGHVQVDVPAGRPEAPVLLVTGSYPNCPFALALPAERTEAIRHGLVEAFASFGCVPHELWWDNPATVAVHLFRGRERTLHPRYAALARHYTLAPTPCLPAKGREEPRVGHRADDLQRRWAAPVPRAADRGEPNAHRHRCCLAERERVSGDPTGAVGVRCGRDRAAALVLPAAPVDACAWPPGPVDKYQAARFDHNRYSAPRRWASRPVLVKGYIEHVAVVADGQAVARQRRRYGQGERVPDPRHDLVTLQRKPAAPDRAPVCRDWQLPGAFAEPRQAPGRRHGVRTGARPFILVLQLLAHHPVARVEQAVVACRGRAAPGATAVIARGERPAPADPGSSDILMSVNVDTPAAPPGPAPQLSRFNQL